MTRNRLSRRQFIRQTAAALAVPTIITSTALGRGRVPPASERITVGFIGVGWRGNDLVKAFLKLPGAQCVAVSDVFASRRKSTADAIEAFYAERQGQEAYSGCARHADFRDLLADDGIDAVVIATPDHWHVPVALHAVRAGKDVYVEKPLGIAVTWNQVLRRALKDSGAVFQFGTQQRSSARFRKACELVRNGRIGDLERIEVWAPSMLAPGNYASRYGTGGSTEPIPVPDDLDYEMWIGPAPMSPYTKNRCDHEGTNHVYDNSLGFIAGWGVHPLDIAQWGIGDDAEAPVEYVGTGKIPTQGLYNTISEWDVHCRYGNGVRLHFMNTRTAQNVVTYRPFNEHGTTFFGPDGWISVDRGGLRASDPVLLDSDSPPVTDPVYRSDHHQQNFLDCVRSRAATISTFESAFQSYMISHLSDLAVRLDRKIEWNPETETVVEDVAAGREPVVTPRLHREMRAPWTLSED